MVHIREQLNSIPEISGVYFFKDAGRQILYIGKAVNLKSRVRSYFSFGSGGEVHAGENLVGLKKSMIMEISSIDYEVTDTGIDALILESQLIKKHLPRYNALLKDDKNYFHVIVTGDKFPKIFITHQPNKFYGSESIGPFTDGTALKSTLKYLRKLFPYCTCKTSHSIKCLKAHLGLCFGFCCLKKNAMSDLNYGKEIKEYLKSIKSIVDILSGKKKSILKELKKEIRLASEKEDFEKAEILKQKMLGLENIFQHKISGAMDYQKRENNIEEVKKEISNIFGRQINRIEFYDVSNISGQLAVASMVVFDGNEINPSEYRKFKIKTVAGADDPAMMREALERRFKRDDWTLPDLVIVDGGITQLNATKKVLNEFGFDDIKVSSLAKKQERLFLSLEVFIPLSKLSQDTELFIKKLRDEAHRFAISYHKRLRHKKLQNEFENLDK